MTDRIRKQIYINRRQQALLKRLSRIRGLSEAEIIRQAIDREAGKILPQPDKSSEQAWQEELSFMRSLQERTGQYSEPLQWNREALYEERMKQLQPRLNQIPVILSEDFQDSQVLEGMRFSNLFLARFELNLWINEG